MAKATGTELATEQETGSELATATAIEETAITPVSNQRLSVFNVGNLQSLKGIHCPPIPISVRGDCQKGMWKLFDDPLPGDITMSILKRESYYGAFSPMYAPSEILQIWFVAESGPLPKDTVMVTYIKERSLNAFNRLVATLIAKRTDPSTGIFKPKFQSYDSKKSGTKYYGLVWDWEPRTDMDREAELSAVVANHDNQLKMIDNSISNRLVLLGEQSVLQPKEASIEDF